jgi:hypothetical protein
VQSAEEDWADIFDPADASTGHERFCCQMHIHHGPWSGPTRVERRRHDLQRPVIVCWFGI